MDDLMKSDLYELLNISITAEEKEIKKAYRKKALTCHPDKNPDNPKAAELFQQLSKALEILLDSSARAAYDKVLNARKASQIRNKELDSKRRKLKEDLEAREKNAENYKEVDPAVKLREEIERLRKEGSKLLEQEKELLRQEIERERFGTQLQENVAAQQRENAVLPRLKYSIILIALYKENVNKEVLLKILTFRCVNII
ncbi:dnaJ homolog subfamily C member 17-like [Uloborus diversus]|uniref:dnaJ homolog subfamily C member 17-like n=1 Tax=Uloborus diversus TaxID=327109 RepID=UPI00240928D6|nr:dnaJ homolog subfamily C member 17-like [Uloborus diversus]